MRTIRTHIRGLLPALVLLLLLLAASVVSAKAAGGPVITEQPVDQYTPISVSSVYFHVKAQGDGLQFQWYWYGGPTTSGAKTPDTAFPYPQILVTSTASESTMRLDMYNGPNSCLAGTHVFCRVTDKNGNTKDSDVATAYIKPEIQVQPTDQSAREGETVTLTFRVRANLPVYRWQICPDGASMYSDVEGGNKEELPLTVTGFDNAMVRCIVTDKWNNEVTSDEVKVTNLNQYDAKITRQPADQYTALSSDTAAFTVKAEGEDLRFVWYWFGGSAAPNATYETALLCPYPARSTENSSTLNLNMYAGYVNGIPHTKAGTHVFCRVYAKGGKPVDSRIATAYTRPEFTAQPTGGTFAEGESVTLSCKARGIQPKYQWYRDVRGSGFAPIEGAIEASYQFDMKLDFDGARYYCEVTDAWGNKNKTYPVTTAMKNLEIIKDLSLTFKPPAVGKTSPAAEITLPKNAPYSIDGAPQWQPVDSSRGSAITAGETYTFRVVLKPNSGYRFSTAALSDLFSSDTSRSYYVSRCTSGFYGRTSLTNLRAERLVLDVRYSAGLAFYIQPWDAVAEDAGDEVYINAKVKGNNGDLKYCLYLKETVPDAAGDDDLPADENEPLPIDESDTGNFQIRAEKTKYSYYIIARDYIPGTDQYLESAPSQTFTVSVREKTPFAITQQPHDILVDELTEGGIILQDVHATADGPRTFQLFKVNDGGDDILIDENANATGTNANLYLPTQKPEDMGTYYVLVTDLSSDPNQTLKSNEFTVSLADRAALDQVALWVEVPQEPWDAKMDSVQLLSPSGNKIDALSGDLPYEVDCMASGGKSDATGADLPLTLFVTYRIKQDPTDYAYHVKFRFTEDTVFTVNGKAFTPEPEDIGTSYAFLRIPVTDLPQPPVPDEPDPPSTFIKAVGLTYSQPVAGQPNTQPNLEVTMDPEDVLFSLENAADIRWGRQDGETLTYDFDSFSPGETYCFIAAIQLNAEETRGFSKDTAFTAADGQGGAAKSDWEYNSRTLTVTVTCTLPEAVPAAGGGSTITFEPEGGTPVEPLCLPAGSDLSAPEAPQRKDHSFGGWYRDEGLTTVFDFGKEKMPDHDITLFAKWKANEASISGVLQPEGSEEVAYYIPNTDFTADVSVAVADPSTIPDLDALSVILASYDEDGKYLGITYAHLERTKQEGVYHAQAKVSNKSGEIRRLSVFAMKKKDSTPLAEAMSFWQEIDSSEP